MLPWHSKGYDRAHPERRKKAFICAGLSYLLLLIFLVFAFQPAKKKPAALICAVGTGKHIRWGNRLRAAHSGRPRRPRRAGKGRVAERPEVSAPQKPPSEVRKNTAAPRHKKKRAKDPLKKRAIKRGKEKPAKKLLEKSLAPPPAKKPDKKREEPVPPVKKREERPMILDKKASEKKAKREKPPIPVPAPAKRAELPVAEQRPEPRAVPEPEALPAPEIPEKAEQTASVPPVAAEEPVEEPLEIEVGNGGLAADGVAEDADDELGVSRDEYALMGAVERAWRPPRGLKPGLAARLTVTVSAQGRADQVAIVVSSRVPAYDIAARAALYRAEYPPVFWGKSIAVVFGQEGT